MYGALWRALPGPAWARAIILVVAATATLAALVLWGFPWVQSILPQPDVTVEGN